MKRPLGLAVVAALAISCATGPTPAPPAAAPAPPPPVVASSPAEPSPAVAPPVLRVALTSDQPEFRLAGRGAPWILSAPVNPPWRGPLTFRPVAPPSVFRIQIGAFSEPSAAQAVAHRCVEETRLTATVVFSADRGLYQVRAGSFPTRAASEAGAADLGKRGFETAVVSEADGPPALSVTDESGVSHPIAAPSVDVFPPDAGTPVTVAGKSYRGALRVFVNPRGSLTVANLVNLEDYLRGVVPAEMGPKRFDELEALKAQAVAARTYALAERGGFEAEGYDLCATPKCQVYGGIAAEDPLSDEAVSATRGLVAESGGKLIHAYFTSTCGGHTEDGGVIFPAADAPYLAGIVCGEQDRTTIPGRPVRSADAAPPLEWRGTVFERMVSPKSRKTSRAALWESFVRLAGRAVPAPASLSAAAVYSSIIAACGLDRDPALQLTEPDEHYAAGPPDPAARLSREARRAYDLFVRLKLTGEGGIVPPPQRTLSEREFSGLLLEVAVRLGALEEMSARFVRRNGGELQLKTSAGRISVTADPDLLLARLEGGAFYPSSALSLSVGDPVRLWRSSGRAIALASEYDAGGGTFESGSTWTTWIRRVSGKELASRIRARVAGSVVRAIEITKRGKSGRAVGAKITTDLATLSLTGFDLRQALELPELLFSVQRVAGATDAPDFVFVGRGWGHGVGLCQNGAYGMALAGRTYDQILKTYYSGIDIATLAP